MKKAFRFLGMAVLFAVVLSACTRIQPGSVGIKVDLLGETRSVDNIDVVVGRVFYNPFTTDVIQFPYHVQRYEWWGDDMLRFNSTEGVRLGVEVAISLGVDPDRAAELYVKYRKTLSAMIDNEVRDRVNGCLSSVGSRMRVDSIVGEGRSDFIASSLLCIEDRLVGEGFIVNDLQLTSSFDIPSHIQARIDEQIQAQQAAIAAQNTVAQREAEALQREAQARGEANARLLEAAAEAEAINIQGAALRENPEILALSYIEKWDGIMPLVVGADSGLLLDFSSLQVP